MLLTYGLACVLLNTSNKKGDTMEKQSTIGLYHTPESMQELEDWLVKANDPMVLTGAMMMYNLMVTRYNKLLDEVTQ